MTKTRVVVAIGLLVLGGVIGSAFGPHAGRAQTAGGDVAIATDAGGTWVVRGDKLMLCRRKLIQSASNQPPEIECGRPATLP